MTRAIVLGAGMVGQVIGADLADDLDVGIADIDEAALAAAVERSDGRVAGVKADLSDAGGIGELVAGYDLVCGAMPSRLGYAALEAVIRAGKPYCDISFMPEDAWELDDLAREHGVTAVVDCGVAPGMSNWLAGHGVARLDRTERIEIYVGGLPAERRWPWQYKAGFAPSDVIEEYLRPSRIVEHGEVVVRPALSEPELLDFEGVGTLEAFNTDGLRSMTHFLEGVPFMKEKTMRYPGHIELMRVLREAGFFSPEPVDIGGAEVRPIDFTSRLLFREWKFEPGEADLTVMRVIVEGEKEGSKRRLVWDLLHHYEQDTQTTSMSRTTASPCAVVARLIAAGEVLGPGVLPPEVLGKRAGLTERVLTALEQRGVVFEFREESF